MKIKDMATRDITVKARKMRGVKQWLTTKPAVALMTLADHLNDKYNLDTWQSVDESGLRLYMTAGNLTGLKDESLATLLNSLVYSNPDSESTSDYPGSFSREFRFNWNSPEDDNGDTFQFCIVVTARFKEDSETCKRVIVGYKEPSKEPTPIYKLECVDPAGEFPPVTAE